MHGYANKIGFMHEGCKVRYVDEDSKKAWSFLWSFMNNNASMPDSCSQNG